MEDQISLGPLSSMEGSLAQQLLDIKIEPPNKLNLLHVCTCLR